MYITTKRRKKQTGEQPPRTRQVPKQTVCPHCKGKFWAPGGKRMCPRCGEYLIVTDGVKGSMVGFFSRLLEGIVEMGGISEIHVKWVNTPMENPSDSRETNR